jgi:phytoene synthase
MSLVSTKVEALTTRPRALRTQSPPTVELAEAYASCQRITRSASKSFFFATRLLPQPKRRAIEALYAFARMSDDTVDEQADAAGALERWTAQVHEAAPCHDPVLKAWADTSRRYALPFPLIDDLLAGLAMDLSITRYPTFADLELYCYRVASVVGLLSMRIIGYTAGADTYAIKLGYALQLTNILRDVGDDAARGRIYLPMEDLARFGVTEDDILSGVRNDRFQQMMHWQVSRAEALYQASWPGIALLHRDGQFAVAAAMLIYRGILHKIVANDYDVFARRASVSLQEKLLMLPRIRFQLWSLRRGDTRLPGLPLT